MPLLADSQIRELCRERNTPMINPFSEAVREIDGKKVISYGLSSYGYDFRIGSRFKVFHNLYAGTIDPKAFTETVLQDTPAQHFYSDNDIEEGGTRSGQCIIIPPNSFALGVSVEEFDMPPNILAIGIGKSTLARCGMILNVTPLEPGWKGFLTVELSNTTPCPLRVYANEGIGQLLFFRGDALCETNYSHKGGRYQGQKNEVTLPR